MRNQPKWGCHQQSLPPSFLGMSHERFWTHPQMHMKPLIWSWSQNIVHSCPFCAKPCKTNVAKVKHVQKVTMGVSENVYNPCISSNTAIFLIGKMMIKYDKLNIYIYINNKVGVLFLRCSTETHHGPWLLWQASAICTSSVAATARKEEILMASAQSPAGWGLPCGISTCLEMSHSEWFASSFT